MAFIDTIPPAEARDAVLEMYVRQQLTWSYVPNYAKVFCYRPQVMARWGQLLAEIKRPMSKRRFELVTFVAAHELRHSACALAHGKALREFFSDEQILAIAGDRPGNFLDESEQAMLRFTRQVARDASSVNEAQIAELEQRGFSAAEIFDIAATAAGRAFFTKLLDALGVLPDSAFLAYAEDFRRPLTLSRPIDVDECETVTREDTGDVPWESG
jgi:uncharacterized peroxidase-related enzyme